MTRDWLFWVAVALAVLTSVAIIGGSTDPHPLDVAFAVVVNLVVFILPVWGVRSLVRRSRRRKRRTHEVAL